MHCPKCRHEMAKVATALGVVDRCTACHGLWFDLLEHEHLKPYADAIDIGDPETGAIMNRVDRIGCPICPNSPMLRMVDPVQPHIWFESCPVCHGRFYDAGEFRDLSQLTLADLVRRITAKARD